MATHQQNIFRIATDADMWTGEATSVADALEKAGMPDQVRTAEAFENWLVENDAWGSIYWDDCLVAKTIRKPN